MRIMISLPMNGRTDTEITMRMRDLTAKFNILHIDVIDSFVIDESPDDVYNLSVYKLGRTIMNCLSKVDAVYFDEGWEKARGCRIERLICESYGIQIFDQRNFAIDNKEIPK